jgi:hypothetical protein
MSSSSASSERGLPEVPHRAPLSAQYKSSFAYPTIKDRCPVILCKVSSSLSKNNKTTGRKDEKFPTPKKTYVCYITVQRYKLKTFLEGKLIKINVL